MARNTTKKTARKSQPSNDQRVRLVLGALVVGVGALVVWSSQHDKEPSSSDEKKSSSAASSSGETTSDAGTSSRSREKLPRLREASSEFAVLTDKSPEAVAKIADPEAVAAHLDTHVCGSACAAVKTFVLDAESFEVETTTADDYILPPPESFDVIGSSLSRAERATIATRPTVVVVRTHGPVTNDQLVARAGFAATAIVADALGGLVYDETERRIENASQFAAHVITVPLGQPVFSPKQIVIQLYRQEDGTARLLTLGMARYGSPDFMLRGASMRAATSLSHVVNAIANDVVAGKTDLPFKVSLAELATMTGKKPTELSKAPAASQPVAVDAVPAERTEGDPDNDMVELVAQSSPDWDEAMANLFGEPPDVVHAAFDKELEGVAGRARKELPRAVQRFERRDGQLYVKGPFPIPGADADSDQVEWMWVEVSSCDAKGCSGTLSNTPGYATNLSAGKPVTVDRTRVADWMLRMPDGGITGGDSIEVLRKRSR
ncbi:hypothetical protein AKJ09_04333 [Labilithrix luteola]|uniref:DUF2314 domain-containing protein n=1 Tax=Labilithrix luteola TaxID=1391654 RepID=A0A0K1PX06_9BACT|nr:DUF2314 domain-containing protein [Labilithrix luteola]AKU97669.1 hypothetical protein AKJ09_04333 [Labilithrix luteola]